LIYFIFCALRLFRRTILIVPASNCVLKSGPKFLQNRSYPRRWYWQGKFIMTFSNIILREIQDSFFFLPKTNQELLYLAIFVINSIVFAGSGSCCSTSVAPPVKEGSGSQTRICGPRSWLGMSNN